MIHHKNLGIMILLLWSVTGVIAGNALRRDNTDSMQYIDLRQGEAVIWYLGHCGYAVRTTQHILIFDYIELDEDPQERSLSQGFVDPQEIKNENVCIFVTHEHTDHYDEIIMAWEHEIDSIRYFFGWQRDDVNKHYYLAGPRGKMRLDDMEIYTVNSQHSQVPEVAYLVKVDDLVIYHGGDYQGRMGRNAPSNVTDDMEYLGTEADSVDVFFIGAWTGEPYIQSIRHLQPKIIFPMHNRREEFKYKQFAMDLKALGIETPVICPETRGDCYRFINGKAERVGN